MSSLSKLAITVISRPSKDFWPATCSLAAGCISCQSTIHKFCHTSHITSAHKRDHVTSSQPHRHFKSPEVIPWALHSPTLFSCFKPENNLFNTILLTAKILETSFWQNLTSSILCQSCVKPKKSQKNSLTPLLTYATFAETLLNSKKPSPMTSKGKSYNKSKKMSFPNWPKFNLVTQKLSITSS